MAGGVDNPSNVHRPAYDPPPLLPWNGFTFEPLDDRYDDVGLAVKLIAEILQDDDWHHRDDVIDTVVWELELSHKSVAKLITNMKAHGDIRSDDDHLRLTTRWQEYKNG
jgi:hypothetical protein